MSRLPPMGNSFIVKRPFMGLQAGTELQVHSHPDPTMTLFATRSGSTSVRVGSYYRSIMLAPHEVEELLEEVR